MPEVELAHTIAGGADMTHPTSPCPYPPEFLVEQRARLLAPRERLETALASATGKAGSSEPVRPSFSPTAEPARRAEPSGAFHLSADELKRGISEASRRQLDAVNAAIERLDRGLYGWDAEAETWLPTARLAALPTAERSIRDS